MGSLISNQVRASMSARLVDPEEGYNPAVTQFAGQLGISLPSVDFASGQQFFQAYVSVDNIGTDTPSTFPLVLLYSIAAENTNLEKFREFAGPITMGLEVIHTWEKEEVDPTLHEDTADVVEAAIFQVFNDGWYPVPCVQYNGRLKAAKYPLQPFGEGYLLRQAFAFGFQLRS